MYFMLIYFYLLLSGNKFTVSLYFLIFVDPSRIVVNHKGKQNSEKIQRVKIRPSFKANDISMTISSNLLYFNFAKPSLA